MKGLVTELGLSQGFKNMKALINEIPKSGVVSYDQAVVFYHKCWHMVTELTDMLAKAEKYEAEIKNNRDNTEIDLSASEDCKETSVAAQSRWAKAQVGWRELQQRRINAGVLVKYLDRKRDDFKNAMYNMKASAKNGRDDGLNTPDNEIV